MLRTKMLTRGRVSTSMTVAFALLFVGSQSASALICSPPNGKTDDGPASYLLDVAETLSQIKVQLARVTAQSANAKVNATDAIVALKELKEAYNCSAETLSAYAKSKDKNIATSSDTIAMAYLGLSSGVDGTVSEIKGALDGKASGTPGDRAEKNADRMLSVKKAWELAINGIGLGTFSAVGEANPQTKKMDTLKLTKGEHDAIVRALKANFQLPGGKGDIDPIDAAARVFFGFLDQSWKFRKGSE